MSSYNIYSSQQKAQTITPVLRKYLAQGSQGNVGGICQSAGFAQDAYVSVRASLPASQNPAAVAQSAQQNQDITNLVTGGLAIAGFVGFAASTALFPPAWPIAAAVGAFGAFGWLLNHFAPSNPPLATPAPAQAQASPAAPQFDPTYGAQLQAKLGAEFDQTDINKDGLLTGSELQNGFVNFDPANNGTVTKQDFINQGVADEEMARQAAMQLGQNPSAAAQAITTQFQNALGRAPNAAEISQWTAALANGTTTDDLLNTLEQSPEAQLRASYQKTFGYDWNDNNRAFYLNELPQRGESVSRVEAYMAEMKLFYANPSTYKVDESV